MTGRIDGAPPSPSRSAEERGVGRRHGRAAVATWLGDEVDPALPTAAAGSRGPSRRSARSGRRGRARPCAARRSGRSACRPSRGSPASATVTVAQPVGPRPRRPDGEELAARAVGGERAVERPPGVLPASAPRRRTPGCPTRAGRRSGWRCTTPGRWPAGRSAARTPRGWTRMYSGSPVVDITDVIDSSRSGCSMASVWTIIPPIDSPITWARSTPQASSTARASRGHVRQPVRRAGGVGRRAGERRRQPDVAVVEADHVEPARREHLAPLLGVVDALAAEPVDHQQRRVGRVAERVVVELAGAVGGPSRSPCHGLDSGRSRVRPARIRACAVAVA